MKIFIYLVLINFCSLCLANGEREVLNYYDIEDVALPEGEKSVDAVAFLPNGNLVCSLSLNKIYIYNPNSKQWRLFAEGLHTPLGILAVSNDEIIVAQRPELTRIKDTDGDGTADHFETVTDAWGMSGNYAEWAFGPIQDEKGNLFFSLGSGSQSGKILSGEVRGEFSLGGHQGRMNSSVPYRGWIMKVTPDGEVVPYAKGMRQPNMPGFDSQGNLFAPDNQGDWVGSTQIYQVKKGGFYGWVPALAWQPGIEQAPQTLPINELFKMRTPPAVTIPYGDMSNSATQILNDSTGGKFGPFSDQVLIGEMNHTRIMRLMLEEVGGQMQGAVVDLISDKKIGRGTNRMAFDEKGSLWIGQTFHPGWAGGSSLKKITWKGGVQPEVKTINLTENGFKLRFTTPLEKASVMQSKAFRFSSYFYNYHPKYGSDKQDEKAVQIRKLVLSEDGREVMIELDDLAPWRLYDIQMTGLKDREGRSIVNERVVYTLNKLKSGNTPPQAMPLVTSEPTMKFPTVPAGLKSIGGPQGVSDITPPLTIDDTDGKGFDIRENGELVLHYNATPIARADGQYKRGHYVHPLYGFNGTALTQDMPEDHPHHRGVFWAWPQLWVGKQQIENPWEQKGVEWDVSSVEPGLTKDRASLKSEVIWKVPSMTVNGKAKEVIAEKSVITVHRATENYRLIDFEISLTALADNVRIGGSENTKSYGGFSMRMPLPKDLQMYDAQGVAKVNKTKPSNQSPWLNYRGSFSPERQSSVAIMAHPSNPGYPNGWTVRSKRSAQNAVFPGAELYTLSKDKPLVLKYSLLIQKTALSDAELKQVYQEYQRSAGGKTR